MSNGHVVDFWSDGDNTFRPHRPDWQNKALCKGEIKVFFDEGSPNSVTDAKRFCNRCPVRRMCLQFALQNDEIGVWGATTTMERQRLKRQKRRKGDFTTET